MKNTKLEMTKAEAAPATVPGGDVDFSEVAEECFPVYPADVAERVKAHLAAAALFGRLSLGHAIAAGWLLHSQRIHTPWGEWGNWCRDALGVSDKTANNYIGLFAATVGAARKVDGIPFENYITKREMESATLGMEDKSVTRAMVELGVVKRNPGHGGDRSEAAKANGHAVGRPTAAPSPEERSRRDWIAVLAPMRKLTDVSYRFLPLSDASAALADLDAARERLMARIEELKHGGIRKGDWDEAPEEAEP